MDAEVERSQIHGRVLHGMRDSDCAIAFGVGEVRGAMGAHASGEPQRLRKILLLLAGGVGRQQGPAGMLRSPGFRHADPKLTRSELGLIELAVAVRGTGDTVRINWMEGLCSLRMFRTSLRSE